MSASDSGLQPQRTALAWNRTGLAVFVNALLALRAGTRSQQPLLLTLGIGLLLVAALVVACGALRRRQLLQVVGPPRAPSSAMMAGIVAAVWLASMTGFEVILTGAR